MLDVERAQRAGNRLLSADISLNVRGFLDVRRRMLGVSRDDPRETSLLYVFTWPDLYRGSSLIVQDAVKAGVPDRMWMSLPRLASFREIEARSLSLLVPGTGLSYEDARGWITPEKYDFVSINDRGHVKTIEARPKNDSLAAIIGSARLVIDVDPARHVVTRVEYYDRSDRLSKRYAATDFVSLGGHWYPTRVRTSQTAQELEATITYRYLLLPAAPPSDLFRNVPEAGSFLDRLLRWRDRHGWTGAFPDSVGGTGQK